METVVIPSPEVPGPAAVTLALPDGWTAGPAPSMTALIVGPALEGHFRPNIVVSHDRMPADVDTQVVARAGRTTLEALPEFEGGPDRVLERDGRWTLVREYAFRDAGSGLGLYQLQIQTLFPIGSALADLVTLTGTCSGGELDLVPVLRSVAESLSPG